MTSTDPRYPLRDEALSLLDSFCVRILPSILRRIASWKSIAPAALRELGEDIVQELTVDCLQRPAIVVAASTSTRHSRWIRITERWIYYQYLRPFRRGGTADPDSVAAPTAQQQASRVGEARMRGLVRLKNGRCNLRASADETGHSTRAVRRLLERLADDLDPSDAEIQFWRRRLAEALAGLGADLLRQGATLRLLPSRHREPDPPARLRRIRRLARRFPMHRTPLEVRRILFRWIRAGNRSTATARQALHQATRLCPDHADAWLWLFEAAIADGDTRTAAKALRSCQRRASADQGRLVLARARLLEVRGRWSAAVSLLQRAIRRWPGQSRLRLALATLPDGGTTA